ncbi:hypothetical protein OUZ56_008813 [Daphnia magna]|uniref:Uncharacterized protein n=1 Tax=Daphnia magna TaxID=35525 RepID=A0ABR0AE43_9CRUS|nr:hypothetical protein OUZ56_008813 [Daphnia magna]
MEGYAVLIEPQNVYCFPRGSSRLDSPCKTLWNRFRNDEGGCRLSLVFMLSWREAENVRFFDGSAHATPHKSRKPTPSGVIRKQFTCYYDLLEW